MCGDLLDELVPPAERGKYVIWEVLLTHSAFQPTTAAGRRRRAGSNVDILRNGGTANEHYIRIHWRRGECDVPPSK